MNRGQKLIAAEAAAAFALIMLYIWRLRFPTPNVWIFILVFRCRTAAGTDRTAWDSGGRTSRNARRAWRRRYCY